MAMTDRKRKTDAAWKKKNKTCISCTLYRSDAQAFRAYAAKCKKSVNELLREYVSVCLGRPLERRSSEPEQEQEQTDDTKQEIG